MDPAPERKLTIEGEDYQYDGVLKSDYFSVNYLYRRGERICVLKVSRFNFMGAFLFQWFARCLHRWEWVVYERLEGIPYIPRLMGRHGNNGLIHEFIPGSSMKQFINRLKLEYRFDPRRDFKDSFFPRLQGILKQVHERDVAYIDMAKLDNIIVDENGDPWLIDFQISLAVARQGWLRKLFYPAYRHFTREDCYHLLKYKRRYRPDQMTEAETRLVTDRPGLNNLHKNLLRRPYLRLKRCIYPKGAAGVARWRKPAA
ncbi:hypothetical protein [Coraliomargarita parva]|uniref:hypothetical protein n=1 Tax=Coraliomargarita parva TaxID=3014050 RepID=UPI0022B40801|nr:hypothetical protein [Coraliomargarita parva]